MIAARHSLAVLRWPVMIASWLAWGFIIGLVVAVTVPTLFDMRPLTVLTGSMRPAIEPGDMVVDEEIRADQVRIGDIITFQEPRGERTITHRVRKVSISEGQARVTTQGDANDKPEKWEIPVGGTIGRVAYTVPKIGYPVTWSHSTTGRLALVSIPALILALWAMWRIWRPNEDDEGELAHG